MISPTPLEQLLNVATERRVISIGLPTPACGTERRFPLTPEAAGMLVEHGFDVRIQAGAADTIHYDDLSYRRSGAAIVDRAGALRSDIVISLSALDRADAMMLKRGALLLTLQDSAVHDTESLRVMLGKGTTLMAIDLVADDRGNRPFSDILDEISGRASIAIASSLLADAVHGKGILLGGIAGIVPCEITIIGSGIAARAAARSATGSGAMVRMFDNDVYRLRSAIRESGPGVMGSSMHPHVLVNALKSADVVIASDVKPPCVISGKVVEEMKRGVVTFDICSAARSAFPSMKKVDLALASPTDNSMDGHRVCYINPGNAVPRTAAMALSNTFMTMINDIFSCDGITNALKLNPGMRQAVLAFLGKPVNADIARSLGMRNVDINLILQFS